MNSVVALPFGLSLLRRLPIPHKLGVLERLFGRALSRNGIAWVQTASGTPWKLDLRSSNHRWIVYGDYEGPLFLNWARKWLRDGGAVIDSGANIGQTLLYFGAMPGVSVFAFEPDPDSVRWLTECLQAQRGWRVEIVQQGLSDSRGAVQLLVPEFTAEHGAQATLRSDWYGDMATHTQHVPVGRLDDFLDERGIDQVRLWKLDVEGWEDRALRGAERALRARRIDAAMIEVSPENAQEVVRFLGDAGYRLHHIDAAGKLQPVTKPSKATENHLALPL